MKELELTNKTAISIFTDNKIDETLKRIENEVMSFVPDLTTVKSRNEIASLAHKVSKSKVVLDNAGKTLTQDWKKKSKLVDSSRKEARDFLDALRDKVRKPLTEFEAEEERKKILIKINAEIEQDHIEALSIDNLFNREKAIEEKERIAAEKEAEVDRLKEEKRIIAEKIEYERKLKEQAAEDARLKAEQDALSKIAEAKRLESEAILKAEQEKQKAFEFEIKAKLQKEQAEKDRLQAIENARIEKEQAITVERNKAIAEAKRFEQSRLADEKEKQLKADLLAADKSHRSRINKQAMQCFISNGFDESQAKHIVTVIAKRLVDNVTINY